MKNCHYNNQQTKSKCLFKNNNETNICMTHITQLIVLRLYIHLNHLARLSRKSTKVLHILEGRLWIIKSLSLHLTKFASWENICCGLNWILSRQISFCPNSNAFILHFLIRELLIKFAFLWEIFRIFTLFLNEFYRVVGFCMKAALPRSIINCRPRAVSQFHLICFFFVVLSSRCIIMNIHKNISICIISGAKMTPENNKSRKHQLVRLSVDARGDYRQL
jgi:hypothetical protein